MLLPKLTPLRFLTTLRRRGQITLRLLVGAPPDPRSQNGVSHSHGEAIQTCEAHRNGVSHRNVNGEALNEVKHRNGEAIQTAKPQKRRRHSNAAGIQTALAIETALAPAFFVPSEHKNSGRSGRRGTLSRYSICCVSERKFDDLKI